MKKVLATFLKFNNSQKSGILLLFSIIIALQLILKFADFSKPLSENKLEKQQWLALQTIIDSVKQEQNSAVPKIYPFNPNFITDFKGYKLGMSTSEIDRLLEFRKTNKYVNSPQEFQAVTKVSDSLLDAISPYFKFPDWVKNKKSSSFQKFDFAAKPKKEPISVKDINTATQEDLMKVYGIGEGLSTRILKERERFGNFLSIDQIDHVWGLSPEVIAETKKYFKIIGQPNVKKIKINEASLKQLMELPYFRYQIAKEIIIFRSSNGDFQNTADLTKIKDFPTDKIKIIALYLEF
ncbi:MAG: hypothetical protein RLZZ312_209 [Bacteroidota bacterium]|jgi:DNA uptake protein ComE-like DNA-binding protein